MSNVIPANIRRFTDDAPIRPRVRIAGLSLDERDPFSPLLHALMPLLIDARTRAERARVAVEDAEGGFGETLARSTWETAQARALGFEQAVDVVREHARKGSRP